MEEDHNNKNKNIVNENNEFVFPEDYNYQGKLIELTPENELKFVEGDHANPQIHSASVLSQSSFTIKNIFNGAILFKIQTTSPLHYRVKPSHGRIEAGEIKEVSITMSSDSKKSDKFLINVVPTFIPADTTVLDFNGQYNLVPEAFIQKYRLKCVTGSGNGSVGGSGGLLSVANNAAGGASGSVGSISSPVAPSLLGNRSVHESMTSVTSTDDQQKDRRSEINSPSSRSNSTNSPSVTSSVSPTLLQKELKEAQAEIERLKSLKSNNIAKEWKNVLSAQYGVPPVLVLLVAIFAFMVGLLF